MRCAALIEYRWSELLDSLAASASAPRVGYLRSAVVPPLAVAAVPPRTIQQSHRPAVSGLAAVCAICAAPAALGEGLDKCVRKAGPVLQARWRAV